MNTFYFQHDNNAAQDEKILDLRADLGYEGYGIYWAIIEMMHQNEGVLQMQSKRLAFAMQVDEQILTKVINDYGLFEIEGGNFYSKRLLSQIEYREAIVAKRRDAGAKGGKSKANAKQMLSKKLPKERKGKERKESNVRITARQEKILKFSPQNDQEKSQQDWIDKNFPRVQMLKYRLIAPELADLIRIYTKDKVVQTLKEMDNKKDLLSKYIDAGLTLGNWLKNSRT